ncbi:MAG: DUF3179 domain-containing protein [Alphaproteobacteria bacterium]|nr:DUF3179 domain-containing protein [Alphaproteobacteria bacterium]
MKKIILVGGGGIIGILAVAIGVFVLTSPDLGQMPPEAVDSGAVGTDTDPSAETTTSTATPEPTPSAPTEIASATLLEAQDPPGDWTRDFPEADFTIASVDFGSILSGGPPRDGIPAIDTPSFGTVSDGAKFLADTEPVITLAHGGEAKAYPLSILMYHEIVNDEIGGTPVAVTFCPLCNSTVVFVAEMDGQILDFGTTGRLRYSDLIMYDRQTETWWQQFVGEGIIGTHTGKKLAMLPSRVEAFSVFRDRFPDGKVMLVPTEFQRNYGINPYYEYDQANRDPADRIRPFLFFGKVPDDIAPLAYVIAVGDRAWSLDLLRGQGRLETDDGLIIEWTPGQNAALDQSRISEGHDIGNVTVQRMQNGALVDVVHDVSFAFAFNAFHPDGEIVQ